MNFEDLQKSWKNQPVNEPADLNGLKSALENHWNKYQRKLLRTNSLMTLCFFVVNIAFSCIYISYRDKFNWPFDFSIGAMCVFMILYLVVVWRSYAFKKENMEDSSTDFIKYQLKKLQWQRQIITVYSWIYCFLLWVALVFYTWEVTIEGTALLRFSAIGIFTIYIVGVQCWYRVKKGKKQLQLIDGMIRDLALLRADLLT